MGLDRFLRRTMLHLLRTVLLLYLITKDEHSNHLSCDALIRSQKISKEMTDAVTLFKQRRAEQDI